MQESRSSEHPPNRGGEMSELIYRLQNDVSEIRGEQVEMKVEQAILKETQILTNGYIEKSINILTENVKVLTEMFGEMKDRNDKMDRKFELERQRFEYEVAQVKECNKTQDEKLKNMTVKEHIGEWWKSPISKVLTTGATILLMWLATRLGLPLDTVFPK
jgi:hypothetical protein